MKKIVLIVAFLLSACSSVFPTPNDFPPPPTIGIRPPPSTLIAELSTAVFVTPTPVLRLLPVSQEKMADARTFFLLLYTRAVSGDTFGIAERIKYPITVNLNAPTLITTTGEFLANYDRIFNDKVIDALTNTHEENLIYLPDGIRVGQGELWFNLFCVDAGCSDTHFLITQINN